MRAGQHEMPDGTLATALISDDGLYRYALGRAWDDTLPRVTFCMLNPSTATAYRDDPTITRCTNFARDWNAGAILVVNLFALRATNPNELLLLADPVGPGNLEFIVDQATKEPAMMTVCAWGAHRAAARQAPLFVKAMLELPFPANLCCMGKNQDGSPKHPLYLSRSTKIEEYP
jgi:hypothetical protein